MGRTRVTRRGAGVVVAGAIVAAAGVSAVGGCLQILGDDRTFVGMGGGGNGGSTATGGVGGSTAGSGGTTSVTECAEGETEACYTGPEGTLDVGICKGGTRSCGADGKWGATCDGEQLPKAEDPAVVGDEACDGYASQEVVWSAVFGGDLPQGTLDLARDPKTGDILVVGTYDSAGPIDVEGTVLPAPQMAGVFRPSFLARFGADGQLKSAVGPLATVLNVIVTPSGEVLVSGVSDGNNPIGGQILTGWFVGKLNGAGAFDWVRSCPCAVGLGLRMAIAKDGGLLAFGTFNGTVDWLEDGNPLTSSGQGDLLLSKLDVATGQTIWAKQFGDVNDDDAVGLAVDPGGNILLAGQFDGSFTTVGTTVTSDGAGFTGFIAKLTPSGDPDWAITLEGPQDQVVQAIAASPTGDVIVAGQFDNTLDVMDTQGNSTPLTGLGTGDLFLIDITATGEYGWGRALGADSGSLTGLAVGENGDVFGAGIYSGSADLGGGALGSNVTRHGFLGRLTSSNTHVWSKDFGGVSNGFRVGLVLGDEILAVTATGDGSIDFGDGPHVTVGEDVAVGVVGR